MVAPQHECLIWARKRSGRSLRMRYRQPSNVSSVLDQWYQRPGRWRKIVGPAALSHTQALSARQHLMRYTATSTSDAVAWIFV